MKAKSRLAQWFVYILLRIVFTILHAFPIAENLRTARHLARLWKRFFPKHFERAVQHARMALGDSISEREVHEIAARSLESIAMFAVEAVCLPRLLTPSTWSPYVRLLNLEPVVDMILNGRGMILVTAHYGSFELTGHLLAALGFPVAAVMRPLDNERLNRFIVRARRTHGLRLLDKRGAMAHAETLLNDGTLLAFIGDQDAGRKGLFVNFFGRPASTYKSIGLLAMACNAPIVVGYARRCGYLARYEIGVERIIQPHEWEHRPDALHWITQSYTSAIESMIRAAPEQYLWIHRRWKSQPRARKELHPASNVVSDRSAD